ncbi:MAG: tRNA (adenosine(37)-N6)-threonylcarbamoyltransferase complex transferase subunit TsaD [Candidatus Taylorbacteria bacterium]|nr:tRNA (adenosine(37)-N6)-threonylcarbamoyltransferase complex transferase subunit TsaD [Candidatus Taylorbacteria bacterium]
MRILGIETSCDETAISLIEVKGAEVEVLGNTVHSQIDIHAEYGGVFPTLAKREHQRNLVPVLEKTLAEAGMLLPSDAPHSHILENIGMILDRESELLAAFKERVSKIRRPDIDLISVTVGPGLEPALWVGINFARALATIWELPIVPCNHMEGHVLTALIRGSGKSYKLVSPEHPSLALLISGGHTQIVLMERPGSYEIVGETRDDAIGECFDKTARILGLPYPGGPKISELARIARERGVALETPLPRPMISSDDLDLSFSGLKTSVLYATRKEGALSDERKMAYARDIEDSVADVIVEKTRKAIDAFAARSLVIGGGVIANRVLRERLQKLASESSIALLLPQIDHSTDNGLMIALAGYFNRDKAQPSSVELKAAGSLPLGSRRQLTKRG